MSSSSSVLIILIICTVCALSCTASNHIQLPKQKYQPLEESQMKDLFTKFIAKYDKLYGSNEYTNNKRYMIFKKNIEYARQMNYEAGDEVYGVTQFSDMEPEEFRRRYLMRNKITPDAIRHFMTNGNKARVTKLGTTNMNAPDSFDWRDHGAVTDVKNQGSCGSCWSFSTTGNIEGAWFLKTGKLVSLSEQNLIDCDHNCDSDNNCDLGCDGGYMWNAYKYIIDNGGIDTEESYPYEGVEDVCRYTNTSRGATVSNYTLLEPEAEDKLATFLAKNGPVSVAMNARPLQHYNSGVLDPVNCDPQALDHAILLVGYGATDTGKKYWIVKNSWGTAWGEKGYFRIAFGSNTCGIASVPMTALI